MRLGNPKLAVDSKAEEDGLWADCPNIWWPSPDRPMRIKVRSALSKRYEAQRWNLMRNLSEDERKERASEIATELAATLISDWQEFLDESGSPLPYSEDTALAVVRNRDNREIVDFIYRTASNTQRFYYHNRENSEKNS